MRPVAEPIRTERRAWVHTERERSYSLALSESGLLLSITDAETGESILIARRAWDGIVAQVRYLLETEAERARQDVIAAALIFGNDFDG
jgi:hypothetical protein